MAKSAINDIVSDIKKLGDYDIVDSDLDAMLIVDINNNLKMLKQLFLDQRLFDEISSTTEIEMKADQEFIDIGTEVPDLDEVILHTERTDDRFIQMISFTRYRKLFPDPTANKASVPDFAARWDNKIYFGPTPSQDGELTFDYIKLVGKTIAGGTLPYESKYDPILVAGGILRLTKFLDNKNKTGIAISKLDRDELIKVLIIGASKNIGENLQSASRDGEAISGPREQLSSPTFGFGFGGFGAGGFGGTF